MRPYCVSCGTYIGGDPFDMWSRFHRQGNYCDICNHKASRGHPETRVELTAEQITVIHTP